MEKIFLKYSLTLLGCLYVCVVSGQSIDKLLYEGDEFYLAGDTIQAIGKYGEAYGLDDKNPVALYNLGKTFYDQGEYESAENLFSQALNANPNKDLRRKILHNLGTVNLNQEKFEESIPFLKDALRMNPADRDTKYNLSYAIKMLQKQQDQQKEDENKDKEEEKKEDDKNQQKDNKDNSEGGDQKKDGDGDDEEEGQDQQSDQPEESNSDNSEEGSNKEEMNQQQQAAQEMSKEDAELMLQMLEERELESLKNVRKKHDGRASESSENW